MGFPGGSEVKVSAWNAGDPGSIPGSGRSPGEGNGNPLQYSCLENPMEGGAWWAAVHGVAKSQSFSLKEQATFNFMAAFTIHSDFGAQENKVFHCFRRFPIIHHAMKGPDAMIFVF